MEIVEGYRGKIERLERVFALRKLMIRTIEIL